MRIDSDRTQKVVAEYLHMNADVYRRYAKGGNDPHHAPLPLEQEPRQGQQGAKAARRYRQ
mgnify:CR=1 FL=1